MHCLLQRQNTGLQMLSPGPLPRQFTAEDVVRITRLALVHHQAMLQVLDARSVRSSTVRLCLQVQLQPKDAVLILSLGRYPLILLLLPLAIKLQLLQAWALPLTIQHRLIVGHRGLQLLCPLLLHLACLLMTALQQCTQQGHPNQGLLALAALILQWIDEHGGPAESVRGHVHLEPKDVQVEILQLRGGQGPDTPDQLLHTDCWPVRTGWGPAGPVADAVYFPTHHLPVLHLPHTILDLLRPRPDTGLWAKGDRGSFTGNSLP
mmetsp:Transcript_107991/g.186306  ORF Transcript_107991/g.186306 Transcript_107991/m.186306 type:complete len:263 (-) Transcript_107991:735-1523(-)